jgi:hypothetical protein
LIAVIRQDFLAGKDAPDVFGDDKYPLSKESCFIWGRFDHNWHTDEWEGGDESRPIQKMAGPSLSVCTPKLNQMG